MKPVTVNVVAVNYEGAHFRGIASASDDRDLNFTVVGTEQAIVDMLLHNFSYGNPEDEQICTIKKLGTMMMADMIPVLDGCGGVLQITQGDKVVLDIQDEFQIQKDVDLEPVQLGTIDLTNVPRTDYTNIDFINRKLQKLVSEGKLPKRPGDPDHNIYETKETLAQATFPNTDPKAVVEMVAKVADTILNLK